ncbi:MAG: hypothetical protein M0R80_01395 [Proteobacteria bacterium]|jgi:hypothetical protein|nr:hypothetical protein [Pseudomonadota bacterium]
MQYLVKFKKNIKEKVKTPKISVAAACVSEAWDEAQKYMPPGFEIIDVVQAPSKIHDVVRG